jgi:hypothetical protein
MLRVAAAWCRRHAEAVQLETTSRRSPSREQLDVGKAEVLGCAQAPGAGERRMQEVRAVTMMTARCSGRPAWA